MKRWIYLWGPLLCLAIQSVMPSDGQTAQPSAQETPAKADGASENRGRPFPVKAWEVYGNTILSKDVIARVFEKYGGTNTVVDDIIKAGEELQMEYRNRGYPTVAVSIPVQNISSNHFAVKILVFEGRLSEINVVGNRYYSSNNVMRALPNLQPGMILNGPVFQAELDRANANQDRQIYPQISPGQQTNTTELTLTVKDRLPLHAKIDFNNQSSPGTPDLRLNSSLVYNNLWDREHSLGIQYGFSPESYKRGGQWNFYDAPLVANYSMFYRLPLANPSSVADSVASQPGKFGYDEASRQFRLPPASGVPELNIYASRATIDTGLLTLLNDEIYNVPGVRQVSRQDVQQDLTVNGDVGFRLSEPLPEFGDLHSVFSIGFDYKNYALTSYKTNVFQFSEITVNANGSLNPPVISSVASPVPTTHKDVTYLPLSLRWDANRADANTRNSIGLGYNVNFLGGLFDGSESKFQTVAGSPKADGYYHVLTGTISMERQIYTNWWLNLRADGQWSSQPLISNEQFGAGGVNSVHGYREGEVFGDTGWRLGAEQKLPPHVLGYVNGKDPLTFSSSFFTEYAQVEWADPQGRPPATRLWGAGFGFAAGVGSRWQARLIFSWPLLSTQTTANRQPRFDFGLSAQF